VGPQIADSLKQAGIDAVALSGRTSGVLIAQQQKELVDGSTADLGLVGEIIDVKSEPLVALIRDKKIPVIAPLATDSSSLLGFNVNADIAAAAVAGALAAQWLIIMTDVPGIYRYWPDTSSLIESITADELRSIKETFAEGMAPKVQACLDAIEAGALAVRIIDGRDPSALKDALLGKGGTLVIA
jgi:acetylglutamate kinase